MITLIGILCSLFVIVIFAPRRVRRGEAGRRLAEMYSVETTRNLSALLPGSLDYRLMAAGLNIQPASFRILAWAGALAAGVAAWMILPGLPALILASIAGYLPFTWLNERVRNRGREVEKLLPVAIGRITAGLLAGGSIPDVLQKTAGSLTLEGPNPLSPELMLTAAELRSKERQQALRGLAARSPSPTLANLAQLLEGYSQAGGSKYAEALLQTSQRIQQILAARNRAVARAGDVMVSARLLPVVLLVVFLFLTRDPLIRSSLYALPVQIVIGAAMGMIALGYGLIRSLVGEAV